ncbi:ubiquitin carboxyl-terminal hydrolase [Pilobolus umbonatus]|nr:ubiquitin carboxyl-terminal hydrolase [Pilobolus umbonatus]
MVIFNLNNYNNELQGWALIQSDPAIFNNMLKEYQVEDVTVQELYTLDLEGLGDGPVHGLIFVSKYKKEVDEERDDPDANDIFFIRQNVTNACGTIALMSVILNCDFKMGEVLSEFVRLTSAMSPEDRGTTLGKCERIREVHNSYDVPNIFAEEAIKKLVEEVDAKDMEYVNTDNFHYICYIPKNGFLWEMDGLKKKPKKVCSIQGSNWLELAKHSIQERMTASQGGELTFSLMAIKSDRNKKNLDEYQKIKNFFSTCQNAINKPNAWDTLAANAHQLKRSIPEGTRQYELVLPTLQSIENNEVDTCQELLTELGSTVECSIREEKERTLLENGIQMEIEKQKIHFKKFIQKLKKAMLKIEEKQQKLRATKGKPIKKRVIKAPVTKSSNIALLANTDPVNTTDAPVPSETLTEVVKTIAAVPALHELDDTEFIETCPVPLPSSDYTTRVATVSPDPAETFTDTATDCIPIPFVLPDLLINPDTQMHPMVSSAHSDIVASTTSSFSLAAPSHDHLDTTPPLPRESSNPVDTVSSIDTISVTPKSQAQPTDAAQTSGTVSGRNVTQPSTLTEITPSISRGKKRSLFFLEFSSWVFLAK